MDEDELIIELKKLAIKKLLDRLDVLDNNNAFSKLIKFINPIEPSTFLYLLVNLIEYNFENYQSTLFHEEKIENFRIEDIYNFKSFLIDSIQEFPISEKDKKHYIDSIKVKLKEDECKSIILQHYKVKEILEEKMTIEYIDNNTRILNTNELKPK